MYMYSIQYVSDSDPSISFASRIVDRLDFVHVHVLLGSDDLVLPAVKVKGVSAVT
jgi:hypothetical protein